MDSSRGTRHKPASRMATGRSNYLTKQTGEYLVAAELSRRGFIATTFTGNVPSYDIVAVGRGGNTGSGLASERVCQGSDLSPFQRPK